MMLFVVVIGYGFMITLTYTNVFVMSVQVSNDLMNVRAYSSYHSTSCMHFASNHVDHHSNMLNLTSRIAVRVQNLPDWPINWNDTKPQKSHSSPTCSDFLPDDKDTAEFHKRAVQLIMEVLIENFPSLSDMQMHLPCRESPHAVKKTSGTNASFIQT